MQAAVLSKSYAGDISSLEAYKQLQDDPEAILVDVRTEPEWRFVGFPDLSACGKNIVMLSWRNYPDMDINGNFVAELAQHIPNVKTAIYFTCRSGGRSSEAAGAMAERGYVNCFNISDGFEGELDPHRHRNTTSGWRASGLPWSQS